MKRHRAFTLIELLVVIAIISILAAILFPVFAQAKTAAKTTVALSNTKQIGTAIYMYLSDNDDVMFKIRHDYDGYHGGLWLRTWKHGLDPYVKNVEVYHDPVNPFAKFPDSAGDKYYMGMFIQQPVFPRGYFYYRPFHLTHAWQDEADLSFSLYPEPANSLVIAEDKDVYPDYGPWMPWCDAKHVNSGCPGGANKWVVPNWGGNKRDDKMMIVIFLDSHAKLTTMRATCGQPGTMNMWNYDRGANYTNYIIDGSPADISWIDTFCKTLPPEY